MSPADVRELSDYVAGLSRGVHARWAPLDYHDRALPEVALRAFEDSPPPALGSSTVFRWILNAGSLPHQPDPRARFGNPPVTLYHSDHFYIDAYVWRSSSTSIHQHAFCGAFCLMEGTSLQCTWRFVVTDQVNERVMLGVLPLDTFKVLTPGSPQPIPYGSSLIHSVYHLDHPTVTVVIRNRKRSTSGSQYQYHPPGLAFDPFFQPQHLLRVLQVVDAVLDLDLEADEEALEAFLSRADFFTAVRVLHRAVTRSRSLGRCERWIEATRGRHGARTDYIVEALDEHLRRNEVGFLRNRVRDPAVRFFLAALANLPNRDSVLKAVKERYDGDPTVHIQGWLDELADQSALALPAAVVIKHLIVESEPERALIAARQEARRRELDLSDRELEMATLHASYDRLLQPLFS